MAFTDWETVVNKANTRRAEQGILIDRAIKVRDRFNGDMVSYLPDLPEKPDVEAPMPALMYDAIEHNAMRAASIQPVIECPSTAPGERLPDRRANARRRGLTSTHDWSNTRNLSRRVFRHLYGYGTFAAVVEPDFSWFDRQKYRRRADDPDPGRARITLRDTLLSYPEHRTPDDMRPPLDCIFIYGKSPEWIARQYPEARELVARSQWPWVQLWDMVEYIDEDVCVIGILGPRLEGAAEIARAQQLGLNRELHRYPNRCNGLVPVAAPWRITLDRMAGAVSHLVPLHDWVARLRSLQAESARKGVMPDLVMWGDGDTEPKLVNGNWNPGYTGLPNLVQGVRQVALLHNQPSQAVEQMIDGLIADFDRTAGYLDVYRGQTAGALRTGRGISTLTETASDPRLVEMQEIWAKGLQHLNTCVLEMEKEMWRDKRFVVFTGSGADRGVTEYTPGRDFDLTLNAVYYPLPGYDLSQTAVILPQRVGAGQMARLSAMKADPLIEDAEAEMALIRQERMEEGLYQAMLAQTQTPQGPINPEDWARIAEQMGQGMTLVQAFREVQRLTQERQAELAQEPAGALPSPEGQPGVLAPGPSVGAAAGPGPAPPPGPREGFQRIMAALQQPAAQGAPPPVPAGR